MHSTSASLLRRLKESPDTSSWERFVRLYTPLLLGWARRLGLQPHDADDLVQDVLVKMVKTLSAFEYDRTKSFRTWLRTILFNQWRDQLRRRPAPVVGVPLDDIPARDADFLLDDIEYREALVRRALELMRDEFPPKTWRACWEHVVVARPAADVAAELGITVGSVYAAKSRVLTHLRGELRELFD